MNEPLLLQFLDEFCKQLREQLLDDDARWGETWRHRTREGQEQRIQDDYNNYFDQFNHAEVPVPWLKVVGNAYIAWVRESHPDVLISEEN